MLSLRSCRTQFCQFLSLFLTRNHVKQLVNCTGIQNESRFKTKRATNATPSLSLPPHSPPIRPPFISFSSATLSSNISFCFAVVKVILQAFNIHQARNEDGLRLRYLLIVQQSLGRFRPSRASYGLFFLNITLLQDDPQSPP